MNDHELVRIIRKMQDDLDRIANACLVPDSRDGMTFLQRIRQSFNGWPRSTGFEAGRGKTQIDPDDPDPSALLHADPTGEEGTRDDPAARALDHFTRNIRHAGTCLAKSLDDIGNYSLRTASTQDQEDTDTKAEPGCHSCARIPSPGTVGKPKSMQTPWFNRVDLVTTLTDGTSVALCDWCWRGPVGVKHTGQLPADRFVAMHRDGKRVLRSA